MDENRKKILEGCPYKVGDTVITLSWLIPSPLLSSSKELPKRSITICSITDILCFYSDKKKQRFYGYELDNSGSYETLTPVSAPLIPENLLQDKNHDRFRIYKRKLIHSWKIVTTLKL